MGTFIGVGISVRQNSYEAGKCALENAVNDLDEKENCLVFVFATDEYDHSDVLRGIKSGISTRNIVGFTVAGIFNNQAMEKSGVIVGVIKSTEMEFVVGKAGGLGKDQFAAGIKLSALFGEKLPAGIDNALTLLMPDGTTNTVGLLVDTVFERLGSRTKYAGGGSGDNLRFLKTYQYLDAEVFQDTVVGALIKSAKPIGVSLLHGWNPISPPMIVTKSEGNVLRELHWQNAFEVYSSVAKEYENEKFDDNGFAAFAMSHPLGIPQAKEGGEHVIRDPIKKGDDGSITCVGEVPENSVVRILYGNQESLLLAVREAAFDAKKQIGVNEIAGVLVFSCISRCILLKDAFIDEVLAIRGIVGDDVPIFGCMTFGEIGSIRGGPPEFHNKSVVLCVFPK